MAGSEDVGGMVYLVIPSPNQTQTPLDHKHYPKWFCHLGGVLGGRSILWLVVLTMLKNMSSSMEG